MVIYIVFSTIQDFRLPPQVFGHIPYNERGLLYLIFQIETDGPHKLITFMQV